MTDEAMEIVDRFADKIGWSHRQAMREATASLTPPAHNGTPQPMVLNTGGGQPVVNVDTRPIAEAMDRQTEQIKTQNQLILNYQEKVETLIEQVSQMAQAIVSMEIRPTINNHVPPAAVNIEAPAPLKGSFKVEHSDGTTSRVTMES